ncbi:MAG: hypothetical protein R3C26_18460 [Calditrichia bacterium]
MGDDLLKLIHWISEYYICHLGEALRLLNTAVNLEKSAFELRKIDDASGKIDRAAAAGFSTNWLAMHGFP